MERREFEMTPEDLGEILEACKPVPYLVFAGVEPRSPQENANDAWARLGKRMGFDATTVVPSAGGDRFFSAKPIKED